MYIFLSVCEKRVRSPTLKSSCFCISRGIFLLIVVNLNFFFSGEGSGATSESSAGSSLLMPHQHSLLPSLAHHVQQQQQQQAAAASVSSLLASQQHQHQQSNAQQQQQQQQQISSSSSLSSSLSGLGVASDVINGLGSLTGSSSVGGGGWAVSAPTPSAVKRRAPTHACPVCGKHYVNEGSLRKHLAAHPETAHITSALRMWPCSICPAVFPHETGKAALIPSS